MVGLIIVGACCIISGISLWGFLRAGWRSIDRPRSIRRSGANETAALAGFTGHEHPELTSATLDLEKKAIAETTQSQRVFPTSIPAQPSAAVLSVRPIPSMDAPMQEPGEKIAGLPFVVYADCEGPLPYIPSGYMGDIETIDFDDCCTTAPHDGDSCVRFTYNGRHQWAGIAWQDPPNNWGDLAGGYDIRGAKRLSFWARGRAGTERVQFKVGLVGRTKKFTDSARLTTGWVRLKKEWQQFVIPLEGYDLSRDITAFVIVLEGAATPTTVFVGDVRFE